MTRRRFRDDSDVGLLREFTSAAIEASGGCGLLHPGDITHHFFSGNKRYDHREICTIWEDDAGVAAWVLCAPSFRESDVQIRPDLRGTDFEREVHEHAEEQLRAALLRYGIETDRIYASATTCDTTRAGILTDLGWTLETGTHYVLNRRPLVGIPEPALPAGYRVRSVRGLCEAGALADLHVAIFRRSGWTEELYVRYMRAPGYSPGNEYVVEAPSGELAAFTVTWHDERNGTGLFEPVGTHPDHRRKGIGRALLYSVMGEMAKRDLRTALVQNEGANEASRTLYRSCGFETWQVEDGYGKSLA